MGVAIGSIVFEKLPGIEIVYATERYHLVAATGPFSLLQLCLYSKKLHGLVWFYLQLPWQFIFRLDGPRTTIMVG
jgi:hypothetical protein